jgi:hypothetical protein
MMKFSIIGQLKSLLRRLKWKLIGKNKMNTNLYFQLDAEKENPPPKEWKNKKTRKDVNNKYLSLFILYADKRYLDCYTVT